MKTATLILSVFIAMNVPGARAAGTFAASYTNPDGQDQINSENHLMFFWDYAADAGTWSWAVYGWQGSWFYCDYSNEIWGELTPLTDDGTNLSFALDQFGGTTPDAMATWKSMNTLSFAGGAETVSINLNLDSQTNLMAGAVVALESRTLQSSLSTSQPGMEMTIHLLSNGDVRIAGVGAAGSKFSLERTFNLASPDWTSLTTNVAGDDGLLVFTNTPDCTTNNFWRTRLVP